MDAAAAKLKPTVTRVRERDGTIRAEVVNARAASLLEGLTLEDPGAPERPRLTAGEKMQRAATRADLVDANRRWAGASDAVGGMMHDARGHADRPVRADQRVATFAEPVVREVIAAATMPVELNDAAGCFGGLDVGGGDEGAPAPDAPAIASPSQAVLSSADLLPALLARLPCATLYPVASLVCNQWERVAAELADARAAEWSATVSKGAFECMLRSGPNPHLLQASGIWVHHTPSGSTLQLDVGTAEAAIREPRACVAHGTAHILWGIHPHDRTVLPFEQWRAVRIGRRGIEWCGPIGTRRGGDLSSSDERYLRAVIAQRGASSK